jgi:uncharacterized membrane protein YdjX (TVP38/TMEM64 family)
MRARRRANQKAALWLDALLLLVVTAVITLLVLKTDLAQFFVSRERLIKFMDSLGPWSGIGLILLQAVQVVVPPVPGDVVNMVGGFLYGPFLGVLLSTTGVTLGSYFAFALSRHFGRPFVERFVSKPTIERYDYLLHHKGAFIIFLLFLIPGSPKDYFCYILGLGHLSTIEFLIISGTGRLFGTILGTLGGDYIRRGQYGQLYVLAGIALIVVFFAMLYRDKIDRLLRIWHIKKNKKR